jgi:hypothetical protein
LLLYIEAFLLKETYGRKKLLSSGAVPKLPSEGHLRLIVFWLNFIFFSKMRITVTKLGNRFAAAGPAGTPAGLDPAMKRHGCRFIAAQGIEAEQKTARFFVGADSPVLRFRPSGAEPQDAPASV